VTWVLLCPHLQGVPKDLMMSSGGLNNISIYLRSFR
jgi:hypothetical protein